MRGGGGTGKTDERSSNMDIIFCQKKSNNIEIFLQIEKHDYFCKNFVQSDNRMSDCTK